MSASPTSVPDLELVFGIVGATGTDLGGVSRTLGQALDAFAYRAYDIRVIELLEIFEPWASLPSHPEEDRITSRMDAGDDLRDRLSDGSALARLAVGKIRDLRQENAGDPNKGAGRAAYVLRSLKRREEVDYLREIYGHNFFLIGAFAPRTERVNQLASKIATSHYSANSDAFRTTAEQLIQRDLEDQSKKLGQRVGDTFPLADMFVRTDDPPRLRAALDRFLEMVFGHPFHTPTRDEYGMFHAEAAALRSSALSRQVGAAIATKSGSLVAVGTNDIPKAGGGLYWEGDDPDRRDHIIGSDSSDTVRRGMLAEVLERLIAADWLSEAQKGKGVPTLVDEALQQAKPPILRGTQVMRVIEYGRAVHAEMSAIVDAASRGVPVQGTTLFTTTYPCHNCARHIVAAGVDRVVYVEPYPKSLTSELHRDAIVNDAAADGKVAFEPFLGLAPRRYLQFFAMSERKTSTGAAVRWSPRNAQPRDARQTISYVAAEVDDFDKLRNSLQQVGIIPAGEATDGE